MRRPRISKLDIRKATLDITTETVNKATHIKVYQGSQYFSDNAVQGAIHVGTQDSWRTGSLDIYNMLYGITFDTAHKHGI
jgi:hypothetical protein